MTGALGDDERFIALLENIRYYDRQREEFVAAMCFSPDGQRIAVCGGNGCVRVFGAPNHNLVSILDGLTGTGRCVCYSPDGRYLASGGDETGLAVWDAATGVVVHKSAKLDGGVAYLGFSPHSNHLLRISTDARYAVVCTAEWKPLAEGAFENVGSLHAFAACFVPNGATHVLVVGVDTTVFCPVVQLVNIQSKTHLNLTYRGHVPSCVACTAHHGSPLVAVGTHTGVVNVFGNEIASSFQLRGRKVTALCFNPAGTILVCASEDGLVTGWDVAAQRVLFQSDIKQAIVCMSYCPRGESLAIADATKRIWLRNQQPDAEQPTWTIPQKGSPNRIVSGFLTADGSRLVLSYEDVINIWNVAQRSNMPAAHVRGVSAGITKHEWTDDGRYLALVEPDNGVAVWDIFGARQVGVMREGCPATPRRDCVAIASGAPFVATGSSDGAVLIWNYGDGTLRATCRSHTTAVTAVALTRDGRHCYSGDEEGVIHLLEVSTGASLRRFALSPGSSGCHAVTILPPDSTAAGGGGGTTLISAATGHADWVHTLHVWKEAARGTQLFTKRLGRFEGRSSQRQPPIASTYDGGKHLMLIASNREVHVIDMHTGTETARHLLCTANANDPVVLVAWGQGSNTIRVLHSTGAFSIIRLTADSTGSMQHGVPAHTHPPSVGIATISRRLRARCAEVRVDGSLARRHRNSIELLSLGLQKARRDLDDANLRLLRARELGARITRVEDEYLARLRQAPRVQDPSSLAALALHDDIRRQAATALAASSPSVGTSSSIEPAATAGEAAGDAAHHPPPSRCCWADDLVKYFADREEGLRSALRQVRAAVAMAAAIGATSDDDDEAPLTSSQSDVDSVIEFALEAAHRVLEESDDAHVEHYVASLKDQMRRETERVLQSFPSNVDAQVDELISTATARKRQRTEELRREAVLPWTRVGSTTEAAAVVAELALLEDAMHDTHQQCVIARNRWNMRLVQRDPAQREAVEREVRMSEQRAAAARSAYARCYRERGRFVLAHFPEHREQMLRLLPEALRRFSDDGQAIKVHDPTARLADFDVSGWSPGERWSSSSLVGGTGTVRRAVRRQRVTTESGAENQDGDSDDDDDGRAASWPRGSSLAIKECRDAAAMLREVSALKQTAGVEGVCELLFTFEDDAAGLGGASCFYMAMPWYEGGAIDEWAARSDVERPELLEAACEVAQTVALLHRLGIIHGDLKPQNVMMERLQAPNRTSTCMRRFRPRVIDLGSANIIDGDAALVAATMTHSLSGTFGFLAPELKGALEHFGEPQKMKALLSTLDLPRVDVYGLGQVLRSMELRGGSAALWRAPLPRGVAADELQRSWSDLVSRMLSLQPSARPTMEEVVKALAAVVQREATIECSVCLTPCARTTASWCCEGQHVYCEDCGVAAVNQWAVMAVDPHHLQHRGELFCVAKRGDSLCAAPIMGRVPAGAMEASKRVLLAIGASERSRQNGEERGSERAVKESVAELFTIKCPRCGVPCAIDFTQCLALSCPGCNTIFCGYCLQLSATVKSNHEHVQKHRAEMEYHCGEAVPHHIACQFTGAASEPLFTCEPRWRRVWYETRVKAAAHAQLSLLPNDAARARVLAELQLP